MAEIVAAFGVPHTPMFPSMVAKAGPDCETARLYADIARHLHAAKPDVLVIYTDDHFNTFFLDNFPVFAIGIADETSGPNDQTPMPDYRVPVHAGLASHHARQCDCRRVRCRAGAGLRGRPLDHGAAALHHAGHAHPDRADFHQRAGAAVAEFAALLSRSAGDPPGDRGLAVAKLRVAVIGSGSFSLEIGGPKVPVGEARRNARPGMGEARAVITSSRGESKRWSSEATTARMLQAGNIGGELLNWIAMLAVVGGKRPDFVQPQIEQGHAYAAWKLD